MLLSFLKKNLKLIIIFMIIINITTEIYTKEINGLKYLFNQTSETESSKEKENENEKYKEIKNKENLTKILKTLFKKLENSQSKENIKFNPLPFLRFAEIKGLYSSYIHLNF